jgi:hypothetical protein
MSGRSEAESLYGRRSGGYARERAGTLVPAPIFCFHHVDAAATLGYRAGTAHTPILFLAADSIHVDARKHVNTCVGAASGCMALIPFTFPHGYRTVSLQQPAGGDVSERQPDAQASCSSRAVVRLRGTGCRPHPASMM